MLQGVWANTLGIIKSVSRKKIEATKINQVEEILELKN